MAVNPISPASAERPGPGPQPILGRRHRRLRDRLVVKSLPTRRCGLGPGRSLKEQTDDGRRSTWSKARAGSSCCSGSPQPKNRSRPKVIDKSTLTLPEPRRIRDREHVRHVAKQPCLVCGRQPADAHHLRFAQSRALGRKVSDEFTVPLCRTHHREVHNCGDEAAWWRKAGISATAMARTLSA